MKPTTEQAYKLFHDGARALAQIEANGMKIDVERLDKTIEKTTAKIEELEEQLKATDVWGRWKKKFGTKTSLGSRPQLAQVLDDLGQHIGIKTETGRLRMDEATLAEIAQKEPFVKDFLRLEKLKKLRSTYLLGVRREVVDGYLHPVFNLHLVKTYRSSSDSPNFQNIPIRDEEIGRLIRSCFIPRKNHVLVLVDYSALEFKIAACHWSDKSMIAYAGDPSLDIHRDMAAECFLLEEVPKSARFYAKNQFVFPQLYGSYYVACARNLWKVVGILKTADGIDMHEHLDSKGVGRADLFEEHIRRVEKRFHKRFPQWAERKEKWWERYQRRGRFRMMTGFECAGVFTRNELYNWPIQGPAFHLLLWSLVQMQKWLVRNKMKSRIIGQIHDEIVGDVHKDELVDYITKIKQVMTEDVKGVFPWLVVPMEVEIEIAKKNWFEKEEIDGVV